MFAKDLLGSLGLLGIKVFFPPNKFAILLIDISLPEPKFYIFFTNLLFATFINALVKSST